MNHRHDDCDEDNHDHDDDGNDDDDDVDRQGPRPVRKVSNPFLHDLRFFLPHPQPPLLL